MKVFNEIEETKAQIKGWKEEKRSIAFVPTMGFLHQGHGSLIKAARAENDIVVVSIFVNPTQFGKGEDLDSYPRNLEGDKALCEAEGVDLIFAPTAGEMYPSGFSTSVSMSGLTEELCGKSRPEHFGGVCLVVSKLFHIVTPDRAYFGEKDAQQLAIIRQMVKDLDMSVKIVGCPIVRESDGLAMSSRNAYLSPEERKAALILSQALAEVKSHLLQGEKDCDKLKKILADKIATESLAQLDYGEIVDSFSLQPISKVSGSILVALAVKIGKTRLIDNFFLKEENL
ncbi:MAG: pantoate--beta-alanine ligase [Eubacteriales bacterium]